MISNKQKADPQQAVGKGDFLAVLQICLKQLTGSGEDGKLLPVRAYVAACQKGLLERHAAPLTLTAAVAAFQLFLQLNVTG